MPTMTTAPLARFEVRMAETQFPSITFSVASDLTREEAEARATHAASWHGAAAVVSIYDTVTRETVTTITDAPPVVYAVWPKKVRRTRTTAKAAA